MIGIQINSIVKQSFGITNDHIFNKDWKSEACRYKKYFLLLKRKVTRSKGGTLLIVYV